MIWLFLLVAAGAATSSAQETTYTTDLSTHPTTVYPTDETFPTIQTTLPQRFFFTPVKDDPTAPSSASSCKNHFLCPTRPKSSLSKGVPPRPSKNLVPPFTDDELRTTEVPATETELDTTTFPPQTTLLFAGTSVVQKRDNRPNHPKNQLRSFLPQLSPAPATIDLSYLPPKGVAPAAASLDIARVNYLPPLEESPAAAQTDVAIVRPDEHDHHHAHKDICSDAFHSFLCAPLKTRKRITGALPNQIPNSVRGLFSESASNAVTSAAKPEETTYSPTTKASTQGYSPAPSNIDRSYVPPSPKPIQPLPSNIDRSYLPPAPKPVEPSSSIVDRSYLPPVQPSPSNVDRSYLPPVPKPVEPSPSNVDRSYLPAAEPASSFNSVKVARPNEVPTTRKPFATSTARPFIQTSIIPYISPKVIEQLPPSTTTPRPRTTTTTTTRRPTTKTTTQATLAPAPSNEVDRGYLPPPVRKASLPVFQQRRPSVQIITESPKPAPQRTYLPSTTTPRYDETAAAAGAGVAQVNRLLLAPQEHDHHDHHHHHHGRDLCTDPFHSFLCAPLKQRKRITGALPPGFNPQSSNRKETRVRPSTPVPQEEEVPAANALISQTIGYQYPKPSPTFPEPSQTLTQFVRPTTTTQRPITQRPTTQRPTTGYQYPRPSFPFPLPSQQSFEVVAKEDRLVPVVASTGYQYPKPTVAFPLPSAQQSTVTPFPRPTSTGYRYPKPEKPFPLPSQVSTVATPTPSALRPEPAEQRSVGYQYPKPAESLPLPAGTGYRYPKPANPLVLPGEGGGLGGPKPTLSSLRDLGSAEFIPVNKIDAKRQVEAAVGGPRFGDRIRSRVKQV